MEIVSDKLPLSPRVQQGLKLVEEGRYHKKEVWGEGLSVLNPETVKLPLVIRKALAEKKVLTEMPVKIADHELIVGCAVQGTTQNSAPFPDYATPEEKRTAMQKLTGPRSVFGHFAPYYPRYLKQGLPGLRSDVEMRLAQVKKSGTEPDKATWYESVIISLDALRELIRRYRELSLQMAESASSAARKEELRGTALVLQHLLDGPPQTLREAVQAIWFAHIAFFSTLNQLPMGRLDQTLWPYLERDLKDGTTTINEAQEIIDSLWLKCNDLLQTSSIEKGPDLFKRFGTNDPMEQRANIAGMMSNFLGGKTSLDRINFDGATSQQFLLTVTVSGLTPEGVDGTNPMTYICLNSTRRLGTPQPCLYVRFHDNSPQLLYKRVADCLRAGIANPSIYNDESIVPGFVKLGVPLEHARDYTSDGCFEVYPQGRTNFKHGYAPVIEALDRILNWERWQNVQVPIYMENLDPFAGFKAADPYGFRSFDDVMTAFKTNLDRYLASYVRARDSYEDGRLAQIAPLPLLSAFVEGPLESGKDIAAGGTQYTFHMPDIVGLSHAADSLAVIKKLCFEEKSVPWPELLDAVRTNWQGKEYLRQLVQTRAPAYGNDDDYVDGIAREMLDYFIATLKKYSQAGGTKVKYTPGLATFEQYTVLGILVGATPDGRMAEQPLSTNGSPSIGRPVNGQTAAVNSYLKLPLSDMPGGSIIDISIESRANLLSHLESFIKSFVAGRGNMISISVNDVEKLRAAVKEPEKYRDLKVRVAGYEAYFVDLPLNHQLLQIKRLEQYG